MKLTPCFWKSRLSFCSCWTNTINCSSPSTPCPSLLQHLASFAKTNPAALVVQLAVMLEVFSSSAHTTEAQRNQAGGVTQYIFCPGHSQAHQRRPTSPSKAHLHRPRRAQRDNGRWEPKSQTPVITAVTPSTLSHWQ